MALPPIVESTVQAALLSALSNFLAQLLRAYTSASPLNISFRPILQFAFFTLLNTPPNVLWQRYLESTFPSTKKTPPPGPSPVASLEGRASAYDVSHMSEKELNELQHPPPEQPRPELDVRNTLVKFALDQTLGAVVNTVVYLASMAALRGESYDGVVSQVVTRTWPLMKAGLKVWPAISLLSFAVVPPEKRVVFGSLVGVAWGIFLSLFAQK